MSDINLVLLSLKSRLSSTILAVLLTTFGISISIILVQFENHIKTRLNNDGKKIDIHSNKQKTKAGSRHYIHAYDVADGCLFLIKNRKRIYKSIKKDYGGAKCPKFNLDGPVELNLKVPDRLFNDARYSVNYNKLKRLGWKPKISINKRIDQVVKWTLKNDRWLKI